MRRPAVKKMDAVLLLAKASFGDRRRRSPARILITLAVVAGLLGLLAWAVWPNPLLPPLIMAAFDQVALPNETVSLCAGVQPIDQDRAGFNLAGCELFFLDLSDQALLAKVATRSDGTASLSKSFAANAGPPQVLVRYRGEESRLGVFVWPAESRLLVVDADHALADVDEERLWTLNNLDIRPVSGAAKALQSACGKYRVIYLSAAADRPSRYRKLRALLGPGGGQEQFPGGPLLARADRAVDSDPAVFQHVAIVGLTKRFCGKAVGVVRRADEAEIFRNAGLQTFLVGDANSAPEGIIPVKSWADLSGKLPD
jgi:hypothetical protein